MFFCKTPCAPCHNATGAVRVDPAAIAAQESLRLEQEAEAERLHVEEVQREAAEAAERARLEEEKRMREEEEAREQVRAEEARLREEDRVRQEQDEEARRVEAESLHAEQAKKERQDQIRAFCNQHGFNFNNLNEAKKAVGTVFGSTSTYALLHAAELGDAKMVKTMLVEGAYPLQQNSSKKTAAQVAQKKNKGGSHDAVLLALRNSTAGGA